jgi:hypothetical protein
MKHSRERKPARRRTTLTLPADLLDQAERIARLRNMNLSTAVAEALAEGLKMQAFAERSDAVLAAYRQAFNGFTEEERMILDGIMVEPSDEGR